MSDGCTWEQARGLQAHPDPAGHAALRAAQKSNGRAAADRREREVQRRRGLPERVRIRAAPAGAPEGAPKRKCRGENRQEVRPRADSDRERSDTRGWLDGGPGDQPPAPPLRCLHACVTRETLY